LFPALCAAGAPSVVRAAFGELEARGIRVAVIPRYDLRHAKAGPGEQDVARPAEFLLDSTGIVRWVNLTENYWVRARPEQILQATNTVR